MEIKYREAVRGRRTNRKRGRRNKWFFFLGGGGGGGGGRGWGLWEEEELCNLRSLKDMLESKIISASLFFFIVNGENIFDIKIFCKIAFWDNLQSGLTYKIARHQNQLPIMSFPHPQEESD